MFEDYWACNECGWLESFMFPLICPKCGSHKRSNWRITAKQVYEWVWYDPRTWFTVILVDVNGKIYRDNYYPLKKKKS